MLSLLSQSTLMPNKPKRWRIKEESEPVFVKTQRECWFKEHIEAFTERGDSDGVFNQGKA